MKNRLTELEEFFLITQSYFLDEVANDLIWKDSWNERIHRIANIMREMAGIEN